MYTCHAMTPSACVYVCVCHGQLHQDTFRVAHSSRSGAMRPHSAGFRSGVERYVFLFQKMLLIVKRREEGYIYKHHAEVSFCSSNQFLNLDLELCHTVYMYVLQYVCIEFISH